MNHKQKKAVIFFGDNVSIYLTDSVGFPRRKLYSWGSKCDIHRIIEDIAGCGIKNFGIVNRGDKERLKSFIQGLIQKGLSVLCIAEEKRVLHKFLQENGYDKGFFLDWEDGFFVLYDFNDEACESQLWPGSLSEFSDILDLIREKLPVAANLVLSGSLGVLHRNLFLSVQGGVEKINIVCSALHPESLTVMMCRELMSRPEYNQQLFSAIFLSRVLSLGLMVFMALFLSGFFSPDNFVQTEAKDSQISVIDNHFEKAFSADIDYYALADGNKECGIFLYLGQKIKLCAGFASHRLQVKSVDSNESLLVMDGHELLLKRRAQVNKSLRAETNELPGLVVGFSENGQKQIRVTKDLPCWNLQAGDRIKSFHGYDLHRPSDLNLFNILAENSYPLSGFDIL